MSRFKPSKPVTPESPSRKIRWIIERSCDCFMILTSNPDINSIKMSFNCLAFHIHQPSNHPLRVANQLAYKVLLYAALILLDPELRKRYEDDYNSKRSLFKLYDLTEKIVYDKLLEHHGLVRVENVHGTGDLCLFDIPPWRERIVFLENKN